MAGLAPMVYRVDRLHPDRSRWVQASCADVGCPEHLHGWATVLDESTPDGARMAAVVRSLRDRQHVETRDPSGLTRFTFAPGQKCFRASEHVVAPALYRIGAQGAGGRPVGVVEVDGPQWVDRFAEHSARVSQITEERYGNV